MLPSTAGSQPPNRLRRRGVPSAALALAILLFGAGSAFAQRTESAKLLPPETVFYLSIADWDDLMGRFAKTGFGRVAAEPGVKPTLDALYAGIKEGFATAEEQIGATLEDLLALPQGELALAIVAPPDAPASFVLLADVGEQSIAVERLSRRLEEELRKDGGAVHHRERDGLEWTVYDLPGVRFDRARGRRLIRFFKDGRLVLGADEVVLQQMLAAWEGDGGASLADSEHFTKLMKRCENPDAGVPQVSWYVNPWGVFAAAMRDNPGGDLLMTFLRPLGIDGLHAIGGTVTAGDPDYDFILRLHVLMAPERRGLLEAVALAGGDTTPESWVGADVASYSTLHVDFRGAYRKIASLVDAFRGPGAFADRAQAYFEGAGVRFEEDILPILDDRITFVTLVGPSGEELDRLRLWGIRLKDEKAASVAFDKVVRRHSELFERQRYRRETFYRYTGELPSRPRFRGSEETEAEDDVLPVDEPPRSKPCLMLLDGYLLVGSAPEALHAAIGVSRGDSPPLAEDLGFKLIAAKAARQVGGGSPSMLGYARREETLRYWYELLTDEENREQLQRLAQRSRLVERVSKALESNPPPPLSELLRHLAPSGSVLVDDETGVHYMSFTLRRGE